MITACMSCKCSSWKRGLRVSRRTKMARPGAITNNWKRSQKSQERSVQHLNWSVLCFVGDDIWELHTQIETGLSCENKESFVWQSLFARCNKLRILTWIVSWEQFSSSHHNHQVHSSNVKLLLLPEMWGDFCVKTKGNVSVPNNKCKKNALFSFLFDDWMLFAFLSVCFVDEKLFWSRNILTNGAIFLFSVDKIQKSKHFPFSVFWLHRKVVFPLYSLFVLKNNSSFVLFVVLVVPKKKKEEKCTQREAEIAVRSSLLFFNRKQIKFGKKPSQPQRKHKHEGNHHIFWASNEFVRTKR